MHEGTTEVGQFDFCVVPGDLPTRKGNVCCYKEWHFVRNTAHCFFETKLGFDFRFGCQNVDENESF